MQQTRCRTQSNRKLGLEKATEPAKRFQKKHPEYSYKEAEELVGERGTPAGRQLYLGRPITIKNPACLGCHETAEKAPRTLVERYGSENGFGWKVGETIGAQVVSVPMSMPIDRSACRDQPVAGGIQHGQAARFTGWYES